MQPTNTLPPTPVTPPPPDPTPTLAPTNAPLPHPTATTVPTNAPTPTIPPAPPTNTALPAPPQATTGGLGLDVPDWERLYGKSTQSTANRSYITFGKNLPDAAAGTFEYAVTFDYFDRKTFTGSRRATNIKRTWGPAEIAPDTARNEAKALMPTDAQPVRTYMMQGGDTVEVYSSEWLKGQIPAELWSYNRVESGIFAIRYSLNTQRTIDKRNGRPVNAYIVIKIGTIP